MGTFFRRLGTCVPPQGVKVRPETWVATEEALQDATDTHTHTHTHERAVTQTQWAIRPGLPPYVDV